MPAFLRPLIIASYLTKAPTWISGCTGRISCSILGPVGLRVQTSVDPRCRRTKEGETCTYVYVIHGRIRVRRTTRIISLPALTCDPSIIIRGKKKGKTTIHSRVFVMDRSYPTLPGICIPVPCACTLPHLYLPRATPGTRINVAVQWVKIGIGCLRGPRRGHPTPFSYGVRVEHVAINNLLRRGSRQSSLFSSIRSRALLFVFLRCTHRAAPSNGDGHEPTQQSITTRHVVFCDTSVHVDR